MFIAPSVAVVCEFSSKRLSTEGSNEVSEFQSRPLSFVKERLGEVRVESPGVEASDDERGGADPKRLSGESCIDVGETCPKDTGVGICSFDGLAEIFGTENVNDACLRTTFSL